MKDLHVRPGPGVPHGLVIPENELVEQFSKSSGPGGQSVNTTDSRVALRFDVSSSVAFSERVRDALAPPPVTRVPTKPSRASQRRRVDSKVRRGRTKALRGRVRDV